MYDNLSNSSIKEWFHPNEDLNDIYKRCVKFNTYFAKSAQYRFLPSLERRNLCNFEEDEKNMATSLYGLYLAIDQKIYPEQSFAYIWGTHSTAFKISYEWTKYLKLNWLDLQGCNY